MVENDILKKIHFLEDLPDDMLQKVGAISQLETFDKESILFRQNQEPNLIYMVVAGAVYLNSSSAKGEPLQLDTVTPGRTFGVSALLGESLSTFTAVCAEKSSMITIPGSQLRELFENDAKIGHRLIKKLVMLFRSRMKMHTQQFLHSLSQHPEIS